MISVIIPTYKSPDMLDLCLRSCITGQQSKNQIIVVVDGFYDTNKEVLDKYKKDIEILNLEENVGLCRGTNLGVYNARHDDILIVNDDNVFCNDWDWELESLSESGTVWAVNQIEPYPSMFQQFHIKNLGTDPKTFDMFEFNKYVDSLPMLHDENCGSTLPIFMKKTDYLKIGGWDENYPTNGIVADWDFFLKCNLNKYKMLRTRNLWFYHFASATVNGYERQIKEQQGHEYAKYKWGSYIKHNPYNNLKTIV
jgi:glycosyltransferase involved in cell wall biosynthesis